LIPNNLSEDISSEARYKNIMNTYLWVIIAVVVVGLIIWYAKSGKKIKGPTTPPSAGGPMA